MEFHQNGENYTMMSVNEDYLWRCMLASVSSYKRTRKATQVAEAETHIMFLF
jgi:hypothetical protein